MGKPHSELFGIPISEIARICKVDLSTARRWKRGAICPPATALMVLRIKWGGELEELGPEWAGWRYRAGELTSPDGLRVNRNDALSVPYLLGHISALKAKVSDLEAAHESLEEQPEPGEIPTILAG